MRTPLSLLTLSTIGLPLMAVAATSTTYSDVPRDAWYAGYVSQATQLDIVAGYRDENGRLTGEFGPTDPVTVAQVLKMAVVGAGYDLNDYTVGDAWRDVWYGPYIGVAQNEKFSFFINRKSNFEAPATRGEVAQIVADAFRVWLSGDTAEPFKDVPSGNAYARAINQLYADEVVTGDTDAYGHTTGSFRPGDRINRAEAVKLVMRAYEIYGQPAENDGDVDDGETNTGPDAPEVTVVSYNEEGFTMSSLYIEPGTAVRFENQSAESITIVSDPTLTETLTIRPGRGAAYTFRTAGTYLIRNQMSGAHTITIQVTE